MALLDGVSVQAAVPEPASWALLGVGLLALARGAAPGAALPPAPPSFR